MTQVYPGRYPINLYNGTLLTHVYPYEIDGPAGTSVARKPVAVKPKFNIVGTSGGNHFIIQGNYASWFLAGDQFTVQGSAGTGNDGTYTVTSNATFSGPPNNQTSIPVVSVPVSVLNPPGEIVRNIFVLEGDLVRTTAETDPMPGDVAGVPPASERRFKVGDTFEYDNPDDLADPRIGTYTVASSHLSGTQTVVVPSATIPNGGVPIGIITYSVPASTSVNFPGRGTPNYGERLVEGMTHIVEHFASDVQPLSPLRGQLWYKTLAGSEGFKTYNGSAFTSDWDFDTGAAIFKDPGTPTQDYKVFASTNGLEVTRTTDPSVGTNIFKVSNTAAELFAVQFNGFTKSSQKFWVSVDGSIFGATGATAPTGKGLAVANTLAVFSPASSVAKIELGANATVSGDIQIDDSVAGKPLALNATINANITMAVGGGSVLIGTAALFGTERLRINGQVRIDTAVGTAPLSVSSTTLVPNLNADMLDGQHASEFALNGGPDAAVHITGNETIDGVKTFQQQIVSTLASGTKPLAVTSTTLCDNLNADMLDGLHADVFAQLPAAGQPLAITSGGTGLNALGSADQILGVNSTPNGLEYKTLSGTANGVTVTHSAGGITLGTVQPIASTSSPTFGGLNIGASGAVTLGSATTLTLGADPVLAMQAATKQYVDNSVVGLSSFKDEVVAATLVDIVLSGLQTIDGVAVAAGQRVLVKNQASPAENGIYIASAGAWSRSTDADNSPTGEVKYGMYCYVMPGGTQGGTAWVLSSPGPGIPVNIGSTSLLFSLFSAATSANLQSICNNGNSTTTNMTIGGGTLTLNNATSNFMMWPASGVGAPTFTTRSVGTRLVLYPAVSPSLADFALGIDGSTLWSSVPNTSSVFKWYSGTTLTGTLANALASTGGNGYLAVGQFVSTSADGVRLKTNAGATGRGVILRNDGIALYFLITNNNDANGTWNTLRPLSIDLAGGGVTLGHGLNVSGPIYSADINTTGGNWITSSGGVQATGGNIQATNGDLLSYRSGTPSQGLVWLGNTNHYLHFNGSVYFFNNTNTVQATDFAATSDIRLKTDIKKIEDPLTKLMGIRGVTYLKQDIPGVGVIAQEVQEVFPELVEENGETDILSVKYNGLIGLLIEAVKDQQRQIDELKARLQ